MIGAITIFGKNSFIFNFVSLVKGVHIWRDNRENKMSKNDCESFYIQIKMNNLTVFLEAKSLEDTILYNDSQHNIPALQGKANRSSVQKPNQAWRYYTPLSPAKLSLFSKDLIGNIEAQNTNPDLMPLSWALPMVKIAGNNTLGHGLYPR